MSVKVAWATFETWVSPTVMISRGQPWWAGDGVVTSHPDWFTPVVELPDDVADSLDVRTSLPSVEGGRLAWGVAPKSEIEDATADPGTRRSIVTPTARGAVPVKK